MATIKNNKKNESKNTATQNAVKNNTQPVIINKVVDKDTTTQVRCFASRMRSIIDTTMTLKAVCASLTSILDEQCKDKNGKYSLRSELCALGYRCADIKAITPAFVCAVWPKAHKDAEGTLMAYKSYTLKSHNEVEGDNHSNDKICYEYIKADKQRNKPAMYIPIRYTRLAPIGKHQFTPRIVLAGLRDAFRVKDLAEKALRQNNHIRELDTAYVTASTTATRTANRCAVEAKMQAVSWIDIPYYMDLVIARADAEEAGKKAKK